MIHRNRQIPADWLILTKPEGLKQATVKKDLRKGKCRLVTKQQQKTNYAATKNERTKTNKYTRRLRYITNTCRTLLKLKNTKKALLRWNTKQNATALGSISNKHTQIQQQSSNKRNWACKQ